MCSLTKYVVIGGFTAMAAATAAGSDLVGLLAGAAAVGLTMAAGRRWPDRFGGGSCALPDASTASRQQAGAEREDPVSLHHP